MATAYLWYVISVMEDMKILVQMKRPFIFLSLLLAVEHADAQKIDSIYFHLYTDSLKKGQHNYINIDGKLSDGRWLPLTSKDIQFSSSHGSFEGNDLFVPADFKEANLKVKAVLKNNPSVWIERMIWIKTIPDPAFLPTKEDILNNRTKPKEKRSRN